MDFETQLFGKLREAVESLPVDAAELKIGAGRPNDPLFRIVPANPRSVWISGMIEGQTDSHKLVVLAVGRASGREFWNKSGSVLKDESCEEGIKLLCQAIFATHPTETVWYGWRGKIARSRLVIPVRDFRIALGTLSPWALLPFKHTKQFSYEPYV